ncbi:hypothetical protein CLOM_g24594 [Closterium sp. NIES-68]|nr:hypothetical protein CLOM_g24594 [Closterium sp. NIES-68]
MGTFEGHLLPGASFLLFGSWQLLNVLKAFFKHPGSFQSRAWFPTRFSGIGCYAELIFIALGATASILMELVVTQPHFSPLDEHHIILLDAFNNLEHAAISLFFLLYALTCILCHLLPTLPPYLPHLVGACALAQEFLLFHFHSADHMGLEGHYHMLLRIPIGIGAICALLEIAHPTSFMLSLVRAMSFQLQGGVFIQIALCIWVPSLVPLHCVRDVVTNTVTCDSELWHRRAKAVATLQFTWWSAAVVVSALITTVLAKKAFEDPSQEMYRSVVGREQKAGIRRDVEMAEMLDDSGPCSSPSSDETDSLTGIANRCVGR